jgi:hypothetical protein
MEKVAERVLQNNWTPAVIIGLCLFVFIIGRSDPSPELRLKELEAWKVQHDHEAMQQIQLLNDIRKDQAVQAKAAGFMEDWLRASGSTKNAQSDK